MASISREPNGRRTVQFVGLDKRRRSIRLGKVSQRMAEAVKFRVEQLNAARLSGHAVDADAARWLAGIDDTLAGRLAAVGLIPGREKQATAALGPFLAEYVERRSDVKPATKEVWKQVVPNLKDYFGDSCFTGIAGNGTGKGLPDPCRYGMVGQYTPHRYEALSPSDRC